MTFRSKAVIIATGGWGRIYKVTSNSWEGTGDGVGMGFEAGAEVLDPEMVQFHPTGMVWPPGVRGILVTEAVRGEGGYLTNREGKRFMLEYDPKKKELSSRDVVARSIYKEVQAGRGTAHGGAYLDVRHLGAEKIKKKLPSMYEQFLRLADVDIAKAPMEGASDGNAGRSRPGAWREVTQGLPRQGPRAAAAVGPHPRSGIAQVQPRLAHGARSSVHADNRRGDRAGRHRAPREPRGALEARLPGEGSGAGPRELYCIQ